MARFVRLDGNPNCLRDMSDFQVFRSVDIFKKDLFIKLEEGVVLNLASMGKQTKDPDWEVVPVKIEKVEYRDDLN